MLKSLTQSNLQGVFLLLVRSVISETGLLGPALLFAAFLDEFGNMQQLLNGCDLNLSRPSFDHSCSAKGMSFHTSSHCKQTPTVGSDSATNFTTSTKE